VVQTILESFTRCFNPIEGHSACTKMNSTSKKDRGNSAARSRKAGAPIATTSSRELFDYKSSLAPIRAVVSRSTSSSDSRRKLNLDSMSYDADSVAKAKKSAHLRMSVEALEERSMKRKLEIFRGTSSEGCSRPPPKLAPRHHQHQQSSSSRRQSPQPPSSTSRRQSSPQNSSSGNLALSDDEEELIRQTQSSRKRFACGMTMDRIQNNSPIASSVARLFNFGFTEAQKPFGLCFATPVRTASQENLANLSDDKLTDDEFLCRHHGRRNGGGGNNSATISPGDMDQSSYCEDETISSTLYFDQKYSHVVQTRAPMPLFQEHMLSCSESRNDELSKIIKWQGRSTSGDSPPVEMVTSDNNQQRKRRSPKRLNPGKKPSTAANNKTNDDYPPSPVRIRDESLSTSFTDDKKPKFLFTSTAAEI